MPCWFRGFSEGLLVSQASPEKGGASLQTQQAKPAPSAPGLGNLSWRRSPVLASSLPLTFLPLHQALLLVGKKELILHAGALNPGCALELAEELFKLPGTLASPRRWV